MKKILYTGIAALFMLSASCTAIPTKKWVENRINNSVIQYEQKDKQWSEKRFQVNINQKQLQEAFDSTYLIFNESFYKTETGQMFPLHGTGSAMLLNGKYLLSAKHVTDRGEIQHPYFGKMKCEKSTLYLLQDVRGPQAEKKYNLEQIISGSKQEMDYTLLKVKDDVDLPFYSNGLNLPDKEDKELLGMDSIVIGFPLGIGKNLRSGNISQTKADYGEDYLGFKNNLYPSDSGGPIFVIENGEVKYVAISTAIIQDPQTGSPLNLNYGLKVKKVIEDIELQLKSGELDEKTAQEVSNFLNLNKR